MRYTVKLSQPHSETVDGRQFRLNGYWRWFYCISNRCLPARTFYNINLPKCLQVINSILVVSPAQSNGLCSKCIIRKISALVVWPSIVRGAWSLFGNSTSTKMKMTSQLFNLMRLSFTFSRTPLSPLSWQISANVSNKKTAWRLTVWNEKRRESL